MRGHGWRKRRVRIGLGPSAAAAYSAWRLLYNFEAGFFNHRIGEHFFCDTLKLLHCFFLRQAFDIQDKKLSLPNVLDGLIAQPRERMLNRLSLRIEYRALRHHPNVCFHAVSITSREMRTDVQSGRNGSSSFSDSDMVNFSECEFFVFRKKRVFKAHLDKLTEFAFV